MSNILNITNGDSSVEIMKQANIPGVFLPWRDVLHEGPIPDDLALEALSEVRAQFIIERGWGEAKQIIDSFRQRDNELKSFHHYEKVILWFEHDLYDQLQIIQILDWFYQNTSTETELRIICVDRYLGMLTPQEMQELLKEEQAVSESQLKLSNTAWSAFRSNAPEKWRGLLNSDTSALPFLEGAVIRLLEEYPNAINGLSRTAEQALTIISKGSKHPGKIFAENQALEERIFMGDWSFWVVINELLVATPPLIVLAEGKTLTLPISKAQRLTITTAGKKVLAGKLNWLETSTIDRWVGGVHLTANNVWCWNSDAQSISKSV